MALLAAGGLVGLWASYDRSLSLPTLLTLLGSIGLYAVLVRAPALSRWVAGGVALIGGGLALYFVTQYGHLGYAAETGWHARLGRLTGSLFPPLVLFKPHPNAVATFLVGGMGLSLGLAGEEEGRGRWLWGAVAAVTGYGLLITGSRGAWLGLAMAGVLGLARRHPQQGRQLLGAAIGLGIGLALGGFIALQLAPPGEAIPFLSAALDTAHSRLTLYRNSLYLLRDYPFTGIGPGDTFALVYSRYQLLIDVPFLYYAHNLLLSVWLGLGLPGLAGLVWLVVAFYRFVARVERAEPAGAGATLFRGAWLGMTATLVHGLVDSAQFSGAYWTMPLLFALPGLAVATGSRFAPPNAGAGCATRATSIGSRISRQVCGKTPGCSPTPWAATSTIPVSLGAVSRIKSPTTAVSTASSGQARASSPRPWFPTYNHPGPQWMKPCGACNDLKSP